ncbi:MAG TPA: hypothetical protein VF541_05705, partial [Longimicrobium sp.]
ARPVPALVQGTEAASKTARDVVGLAILALLLALAFVGWQRREAAARGHEAEPRVLETVVAAERPSSRSPSYAGTSSDTTSTADAPEPYAPPAPPRPVEPPAAPPVEPPAAQRRTPAVVAASLFSLGVTALLGRRRGRR